MTIQDLGAIGELIGAIAVVASLIYLAIQIRQNTEQISRNVEASRLGAFENNAASANRTRELLILNPDVLELLMRGWRNFDGMSPAEKFRFDLLMRNVLTEFQVAYVRHLTHVGDVSAFEGAGRMLDGIIGNPGARAWLASGEFDWRPEFRDFLEERLRRLDAAASGPVG